jgi:hypothetical protein
MRLASRGMSRRIALTPSPPSQAVDRPGLHEPGSRAVRLVREL